MRLKDISIYVHIPFCVKKCFYCDFNSFAGMEKLKPYYLDALIGELKMYACKLKGYKVRTLFIGGGTPTTFTLSQLSLILDTISSLYDVDDGAEVTVEANPGTVSDLMLRGLSLRGVNRLSLGLQARQDHLLKLLGRVHTYEQFLSSYYSALKYFGNVNVDIMFGLPGQTMDMWTQTLDAVIGLKPHHVSCYSLTIENNTPLGDMVKRGILDLPDEDTERQMYYEAKRRLLAAGYRHYEISNFALPGYQCKHNTAYWTDSEYVGIGAGASSYYDNIRYKNADDITDYIKKVHKGLLPIEEFEYVSEREKVIYAIITGLRLITGINLKEFRERYHVDLLKEYGDVVEKYGDMGFLEVKSGFLRFTERGIDVSNTVLSDFLR